MLPLDISLLRRSFPNRRIDYYQTVDSTMTAAAPLPVGSIVLAEEQIAGQGRHGHTWHSEPYSGIYCSIVLQPAPLLTLALGLATADAIATAARITPDLRWPNDVLIGPRKIAGILVQLINEKAIAGIGINVNHTSFPPELAGEATSVRLALGRPISRDSILLALIPAIGQFTALDPPDILRLFTRSSTYAAGRHVTVHQPGGDIEGVTAGLNSDGFLIVRQNDGTETLILAGGVRAVGA